MAKRLIDVPDGEYCDGCELLLEDQKRDDREYCGASGEWIDHHGFKACKAKECLAAMLKPVTDEKILFHARRIFLSVDFEDAAEKLREFLRELEVE